MEKRFVLFALLVTLSFVVLQKWISITPTTPPLESVPPVKEQILPVALSSSKEEYYILENTYQQLVFSTKGGALVEINLPLSTKSPQSPIRPIELDRLLQEQASAEDRYPQFPSYQILSGSSQLKQPETGGYYPLLRRSILDSQGNISYQEPSKNYALSLKELDHLTYQVKSFNEHSISFQAVDGSRKITKTYSFPEEKAPYCFYMDLQIEGETNDLFLSSGIPEVELISGSFTPDLKIRLTKGAKSQVDKLSLPSPLSTSTFVRPDWIANSNGFFAILLDPLTQISYGYQTEKVEGDHAPTRLTLIDEQYHHYPANKYPGYQTYLPVGKSKEPLKFRIYAGPLDKDLLAQVDHIYTTKNYNPDYSSARSFHGWFAFISEPFAKFLFWLMEIFYWLTRSWGFSIILLTAALRLMLYPLNAWSIRSSARMQAVSPLIKAVQEKYKKDPKKAQLEMVKIYREQRISPVSGCLPLFIQMPFLIGMFDLLKSTFALRGASFIPGWIDNLAAPDRLFRWEYPIFFLGNAFHLLPILLGVIMFFQQKWSVNAANLPQEQLTEQQKQQMSSGKILSVVFTLLFYHFPSGLNIYWLSSILLGMVQQKYMAPKKSTKK